MKSFVTALCLMSAGFVQLAFAEGTFATIIGPDGRAINIPIESSKSNPGQSTVEQSQLASLKPLNQSSQVTQAPLEVVRQSVTLSQQGRNTAVTSDDFINNDGVEYVDSELLEQKQFNLSDKKRFFSVPNQVGSVDYIERADEQVAETLIVKPSSRPLYRVADNYSVLSASALKDALPVECLTAKQIQKAENFSKRGTKNLWPIQSNKDFEYELVKLSATDQVIYLQSYESKSPGTFYWPLSVFLDQQGCIMQGAATYLTEREPSTWIQKSSLKGVLLAPEEAQYLLMTPMAQMPYSEDYALSRSGSITLQTGTVSR